MDDYQLDPITEIFKSLINSRLANTISPQPGIVQPDVSGATPPETGGILQRLMERIVKPMGGNLERALSAGVPAIPAYRLYQKYLGQPFQKGIVEPTINDLRYVLYGQEPEEQVPGVLSSSKYDISNIPETANKIIPQQQTAISMPTKREISKTPGDQIGIPQYTAQPSSTEVYGPESATVAPEIPAETTPNPIEKPDFTKLIKPWKSKIDYEKEIMKNFEDAFPAYANLPQSKYKESTTLKESLRDFIRYTTMALGGLNPNKVRLGEKQEAEKTAEKERSYVIQKATNLFNTKQSILNEKVQKEELDRESTAKWLEYVGNANPEYRKNPAYQAAVASVKGIPVEQATTVLQSMVDSKTGLLEGMYTSPITRHIEQLEAVNNWSMKKLTDLGLSKDAAARTIAGVGLDAILMDKYQTANTSDEKKKVADDIRAYQKMSRYDPELEKAQYFLENADKIKKSGIFADKESFDFMKTHAAMTIYSPKAAEKLKMAAPEHVKLNEQVAKLAYHIIAKGNPDEIKDFTTKTGMTPQYAFQLHYGMKEGSQITPLTPEPYYTIMKMVPDAKTHLDKYTGVDELGISVKNSAKNQIVNTYKPIFDFVMTGQGAKPETQAKIRQRMQKTPLTDQEIFDIATLANQNDLTALEELRRQIYAARNIK